MENKSQEESQTYPDVSSVKSDQEVPAVDLSDSVQTILNPVYEIDVSKAS